MAAMTNRTLAPMMFALAVAGAAASCQRSIETTPCPCLSGYRCCPVEKACYPDGVRCPSAVPGALAWAASGVPTYDQVGNVYVDEEDALGMHAIALLDKDSGVRRWTERGDLWLRCTTDEVATFVKSAGFGLPTTSTESPTLIGVSTSDGSRRWQLPLNGPVSDIVSCSATEEHMYVAEVIPGASTVFSAYSTGDGKIAWRVPLAAPVDSWTGIVGVQEMTGVTAKVALVVWTEGDESVIQALDLLPGQDGSVKWTARLPSAGGFSFQSPDEIFVITGDPAADQTLVRLASADGSVMWRYPQFRSSFGWTPSRWPGISLLREVGNLVAIEEEHGAVLWTFPLTQEGYEEGRLRLVPASGDLLISYVSATAGPTNYKLVGADGQARWSLNLEGTFHLLGRDEAYLVTDGGLTQLRPESGAPGWTLAAWTDDYGIPNFVRALHAYDDNHLFVSVGQNEAECASACGERIAALVRRDGNGLWQTSVSLFSESPTHNYVVHTDADRLYVFTPSSGALRTGALLAFWR